LSTIVVYPKSVDNLFINALAQTNAMTEVLPVLGLPSERSHKDRILHRLRHAIVQGELVPGERLLEVALARQLGTSRAPVREALRLLEMEGLIDTSAYRETRVSQVNPLELSEVLLPIRVSLEGFALRTGWSVRHQGQLQTLEALVGQMHATVAASGDAADLALLDLAFHRTLVVLEAHPHLVRIWQTIAPTMGRVFALNTHLLSPLEVAHEHEVLLEVFEKQDLAAAEHALEAHIRAMVEDFLRFLESPSLTPE